MREFEYDALLPGIGRKANIEDPGLDIAKIRGRALARENLGFPQFPNYLLGGKRLSFHCCLPFLVQGLNLPSGSIFRGQVTEL
jgi:hypothetical protein